MLRNALIFGALLSLFPTTAQAGPVIARPVTPGVNVSPARIGVIGAVNTVTRQTGFDTARSGTFSFGAMTGGGLSLASVYAANEAFKAFVFANTVNTFVREASVWKYNPFADTPVMQAVAALPMPKHLPNTPESMRGPGSDYQKMTGRPATASDGGNGPAISLMGEKPQGEGTGINGEALSADRAREQLDHLNGNLRQLQLEDDRRSVEALQKAGVSFDGSGDPQADPRTTTH
jgi:hypothetical protein